MKHIIALLLTLLFFVIPAHAQTRLASGDRFIIDCPFQSGPAAEAARMLEGDLLEVFGPPRAGGRELILRMGTKISIPSCQDQHIEIGASADTIFINGSDELGLAFAALTVSRLVGVSPWEWWAEVKPRKLQSIEIDLTEPLREAPAVKHRGIFINDEDWGLAPWSTKQEETDPAPWRFSIGPAVTERICQLLLRLRADTYMPAMHERTMPFFLTPGNREVAERYGIYIATSHCEPLASNAAGEWNLRGEGDYNYATNAPQVRRFWQERLDSVGRQNIIYTLGMRGVHDGSMQGAKTNEERRDLLTTVIADQQQMLAQTLGRPLAEIPQAFYPYKEVLAAVEAGLSIPPEAAIVHCDDNYGYIRYPADRRLMDHPGGLGLYYHVSYWGRPHDYLWLSTTHPAVMQRELTRFAEEGQQELWILNVGDIKPAEYQTQLFLDIAWNPTAFDTDDAWEQHLEDFLEENNCGGSLAQMKSFYDLTFRLRPEFLGGTRTEEKDPEWKQVRDLSDLTLGQLRAYTHDLLALSAQVDRPRPTTAWLHLVQYPVQAAAQMAVKHVGGMMARHGLAPWIVSDAAHDSIQALTARYNNGRWEGFMDAQPRRLPVFERVPHTTSAEPLLTRDTALWEQAYSLERIDSTRTITFEAEAEEGDMLCVELSLLPTHPRSGGRLIVELCLDGGEPQRLDFTVGDRDERWKQHVLRNKATEAMHAPAHGGKVHDIALTVREGGEVYIEEIRVKKSTLTR